MELDLDDAFEQFIVECSDGHESDDKDEEIDNSDKENVPKFKLRTTKQQFEKMNLFAEINEETSSKSLIDSLWNTLASELNDIGPPVRTVLQWRRIWTLHKYRQKKRQTNLRNGIPSPDQVPPAKRKRTDLGVEPRSHRMNPSTSFGPHDQILAKLDNISDNQQEIKDLLQQKNRANI